ncbi:MAG: polyisoprenoid-binding protein [Ignavibacteria bacterium]|nr:polyisoprenoid-binding protein [Ignavibacteria bacterium]
MKKLQLIAISLVALLSISFAQTEWTFDKSHSKIGFTVTHLVIAEVDGFFRTFDGKITSKGEDFENTEIEFTADVNSISTDNEKRDAHLKSDDFFNAEKYPTITFKSKSFKKIEDKKYKLAGDITIRNITKTIELDVKHNGTVKDPWGNTKAGFIVKGELNRFDYGLKWDAAIETGGLVVGKTVELVIKVELAKQQS